MAERGQRRSRKDARRAEWRKKRMKDEKEERKERERVCVRRRTVALVSSLTSTRGSTHNDDITPGNQNPDVGHFGADKKRKRLKVKKRELNESDQYLN